MRFFNLLWALPATLAIGAIWCVSAYANYSFGLSLGSDLFGYASLAVDVAKAVILFGAFAAIAHRHYLASATLVAIWVCCSLWGIASAIGFVSTHYATMIDNRGKTAEEWTQLESQISSLAERRKSVAAARPEGVVQSEIDGLMREAESCAVINGPVTRSLCPKIDRLKGELANAKSANWLDGRLDELRKEMKTTTHVSSVDPRADALAGILGLASPMLAKGLAGFFALMMELITATGLWAVWKAFGATMQPRKVEPSNDIGRFEKPAIGPNDKLTAMYGRYRAVEDAKAKLQVERVGNQVHEAIAKLQSPAPKPPFSRDHENGPDGGGQSAPDPEIEETGEKTGENIVDFPTKADVKGQRQAPIKKAKTVIETGNVTEWLAICTSQEGKGSKIKQASGDCHKNYLSWCKINGFHPVGFKKFTRILKRELGIRGKLQRNVGGQTLFDGLLLSNPRQWQIEKRRATA